MVSRANYMAYRVLDRQQFLTLLSYESFAMPEPVTAASDKILAARFGVCELSIRRLCGEVDIAKRPTVCGEQIRRMLGGVATGAYLAADIGGTGGGVKDPVGT